ncbi:GNAT family N-acetyltransferase [Celeribacter sp. HF31]|uniref:GNAT family N-acetyltransferase n=1 Tax=Celeribacter sp. HF31 TaxID=2721558 RepID=UPI001431E665|nr:GNAT family N-acetyltransferase [Celeribacter sp. HF31]NIY81144.1 GNAT family N-acetyltransferase [Celeribacter sp. HF31]
MTAHDIQFARLSDSPTERLAAHMSDPFVAAHMPLLTGAWTDAMTQDRVAAKDAHWATHGLGHWAFLDHGAYVGWGGFEREGEDWDFGLVLTRDAIGLGRNITKRALDAARQDPRIDSVTFLLPPTRRHTGALTRLGATQEADVTLHEERFLKFRRRLSSHIYR